MGIGGSPLRGLAIGATAVAISAAPAWAPASADAARYEATANGNPFSGGLSFEPRELEVEVGDVVSWTNTDSFAPHTVTEEHGLFDLAGDYGQTPANPSGFGPGETVERRFEAATITYYCRVHPSMVGRVEAPVKQRLRRRARRYRITAIWAKERPVEGQAFDVQRERRQGWKTVRDGTRQTKASFMARRPGVAFRARLRSLDDPKAATGWSPPPVVPATGDRRGG